MANQQTARKCIVCDERRKQGRALAFCKVCAAAFSKAMKKSGDVFSIVKWTANRTRHYERKRFHQKVLDHIAKERERIVQQDLELLHRSIENDDIKRKERADA